MSEELEFTPWPIAQREAYVRAGHWLGRSLVDILKAQAETRPEGVALVADGRRWTFAELDAGSDAVARGFLARGVAPGDRAVVQLPNGGAFYVVFWALLKLRVRAVFAVASHNALELESYCRQLEPRLLVLSKRYPSLTEGRIVAQLEDGLPTESEGASALPVPGRGQEVAFYQLSGGSTSTPKLIPRTHDDYDYSVRQSAAICGLDGSSVYLCGLPAPHNFPLSSPGALGTWHAGGAVVVAGDPSPTTCFPLIAAHGVTITALVPPMVPLWLDAARRGGREALATLRVLQVGGAKLSESVARRIEPELGCRLQQVFGMAEGLVCYTRLDDDDAARFGTQGRPMSEADEIRIVDARGEPVPEGEPGLLLTRGPYTVRGYFRASEHNARAFDAEGFYRTGDVVRLTPTGHLVVMGREKDQINRGGEKIAAEEVEGLLLRLDGIEQAAVVAVADAVLGERSCAYLVCRGEMPKPHVLRGKLRAFGVADFKLPDRFVRLDALPLTPIGKPDKRRLREL